MKIEITGEVFYKTMQYERLCFNHAIEQAREGHHVWTVFSDDSDDDYAVGPTGCSRCVEEDAEQERAEPTQADWKRLKIAIRDMERTCRESDRRQQLRNIIGRYASGERTKELASEMLAVVDEGGVA